LHTDPWREQYSTEELFASYRAWTKENTDPYPADRHALGKFLSSMFPTVRPRITRLDGSKARPPSYRFGTLAEARVIFGEKQGIGNAWQEENGDDTSGHDA